MTSLRLRPSWGAVRLGFALAAAAFAYQGFTRFGESRENFDEAMAWYAVALACTVIFAYEGTAPAVRSWPARLQAFIRRHWLEGVFLLGILGIALFMRLFRFGDYPPSGLPCCGEKEIATAVFNVIHNGERPLVFPLVKYSVAAGFLIFGENTDGFRVPPLVLSVFTVIPFYILLRQMMSAPAALFATALLASSRLFLHVTAYHNVMLEAVLLALFLVRGMKTGSPLMFAGAGLMSGLISYEYEGYRAIPIIALGYVAVAGAFSLLWPPPNWNTLLERGTSLARKAWRPAIAFSLAAFIAIGPLLVALGDGEDLYFRRLSVSPAERIIPDDTGFEPGWLDRLDWARNQFWPGDTTHGAFDPYYGPKENRPLLDPVSATLLLLAVALAAATFWRQFRLFFLVWFVAAVAGAGLIPSDPPFNTFRVIGALIPGFVLIAFLIDDAQRLALRLLGQRAARLAPLLLVVLVAAGVYIVFWNAYTFNIIANNPANQVFFGTPVGQ